MRIPALLLCLFAAIAFFHGPAQGDVVHTITGEILVSDVLKDYFCLETPYGQTTIRKDFIKTIEMNAREMKIDIVTTVNNDVYSGFLLDEEFDVIIKKDGEKRTYAKDMLKRMRFDATGITYSIDTTVITMVNEDRFTGEVLNEFVYFNAEGMELKIAVENINRIEFAGEGRSESLIVLINRSELLGRFTKDEIIVQPDTSKIMVLRVKDFVRVLFNAKRQVLRDVIKVPAEDLDEDGDGVLDFADVCPDTDCAYPVDFYGCLLDTDEDGVPDPDDFCPGTPSGCPVDEMGCPFDLDEDGKLDYIDKCLGTLPMAEITENGCWILYYTLFNFDFDKADLKDYFYHPLDNVVEVMERSPYVTFEIRGYADIIGNEPYNVLLSLRRANAIKSYLVEKGVDESRLTVKGLGTKEPIADNLTDAGRARNRRIIFVRTDKGK